MYGFSTPDAYVEPSGGEPVLDGVYAQCHGRESGRRDSPFPSEFEGW